MTLEFDSCTYAYRRRRTPVLRDLDYRLPAGLTILLGPNGAGKSTLLKIGASVIRPTSGKVTLGDLSAPDKAYRGSVSWMPQNVTPAASLTSREYVSYVGWLKGMNRRDAWDRAIDCLRRVELSSHADAKTTQLSGGQLRRVGVAAALVHDARVMLLDEPTAGMDPHQRRVFRDMLTSLTEDVRVLMSTHDVADLAEDADHVTVLVDGRIRQTGDVASFLAHAPEGVVPGRAAEAAYTRLLGLSA
ncbi:ABC transporter ATP-binding protein [Streptomyces sp. SP18CS02]|uniref:ABC transporter ATP-binding protein n=1 Tax=Streptomyces sp. SP18CS02 TaxID=3002531 RepID=UPI002E76AFE8|nr:ATP-binding cassette domain-containing protein [Streptomyces sp. SP18CS02]MEE1755714.1 ATP-binding cassette domain-containing protein [Streptomyces sp. SP18CS02]